MASYSPPEQIVRVYCVMISPANTPSTNCMSASPTVEHAHFYRRIFRTVIEVLPDPAWKLSFYIVDHRKYPYGAYLMVGGHRIVFPALTTFPPPQLAVDSKSSDCSTPDDDSPPDDDTKSSDGSTSGDDSPLNKYTIALPIDEVERSVPAHDARPPTSTEMEQAEETPQLLNDRSGEDIGVASMGEVETTFQAEDSRPQISSEAARSAETPQLTNDIPGENALDASTVEASSGAEPFESNLKVWEMDTFLVLDKPPGRKNQTAKNIKKKLQQWGILVTKYTSDETGETVPGSSPNSFVYRYLISWLTWERRLCLDALEGFNHAMNELVAEGYIRKFTTIIMYESSSPEWFIDSGSDGGMEEPVIESGADRDANRNAEEGEIKRRWQEEEEIQRRWPEGDCYRKKHQWSFPTRAEKEVVCEKEFWNGLKLTYRCRCKQRHLCKVRTLIDTPHTIERDTGCTGADGLPEEKKRKDEAFETFMRLRPRPVSAAPLEEEKSVEPLEEDKSAMSVEENKSAAPLEEEKSVEPLEEDKSAMSVEEEKSAAPLEEEKSVESPEEEKLARSVEEAKSAAPLEEDKSVEPLEEEKLKAVAAEALLSLSQDQSR